MSLFIGTLAFADATLAVELRLGVLGGSLLSAMLGLAVLAISSRPSLTRSA
jgi:NhaA family Na+:H+ antiporter